MRVIFGIFLPICLCSFLAFGISVAVLGFEDTDVSDSSANITGLVTEIDEDYSNIELESNAVSLSIYPTQGNKTLLHVPASLQNAISAEVSGDTLDISCSRNFSGFDDFWKYITGENKESIIIYVPDKTYEVISAYINAGSSEINGVAATDVVMVLNAGDLTYAGKENHRSDVLNIELNAGNCKVYNADTNVYNIDMSAGNMDVYALTGSGEIDLSAGNAEINYSKFNGNLTMNVSAGNLTLNMPDGVSAEVECDKSAGNFDINYGDINESPKDDEFINIGDGKYSIYADISAGNVMLTDNVKTKSAPSAAPVSNSASAVNADVTPPTEASVEIGDIIKVDTSADNVEVKIGDIEVSVDPVSVDVNI